MIFVTVGTHEQQFNRLIKYMDCWAEKHDEDVYMQVGFSTYKPAHCNWTEFLPFQQMEEKIYDARIVITHGGPSSFISPIQKGKIPVVVPRNEEYGEHINNHQIDFCNYVSIQNKNIIVVNNIEELGEIISKYDEIVTSMTPKMKSNNVKFVNQFEGIVEKLME